MIVDRLRNWKTYPYGDAWRFAFDFLRSLTLDAEEKEYPLQGDDMFARVMSYKTCLPETVVLEAHRKYIDIQAVLVGSEAIEWFSTNGLAIDKQYDDTKDVEFFNRPAPGPARVDVFPGTFVVLFPHDAHMPKLMTGNTPELIKKVVVKIKTGLLLPHL